MFNIPILIVGIFSALKDYLFAWGPPIEWVPSWSVSWLSLGVILIFWLYKQTERNIVSEDVNLVWAVNFIGPIQNDELRIVGSVHIKESVVLHRVVKKGEQSVGKVLESSLGIWIPDMSSPTVTDYGFDPNRSYPYKAIVGIPIKKVGSKGSERLGVIAVHFREKVNFTEAEQANIRKLLIS